MPSLTDTTLTYQPGSSFDKDKTANGKILTVDELATHVADLKQAAQVVVHCHGVFDLLHPGHLNHLQQARSRGDILVVTLTPDRYVNKGPGRPVFNQRIRAETLAALECVDCVAINEWPTAVEVIEKIRPTYFAKGEEFADRQTDLTGAISKEENAIKQVGGELLLTDGVAFSSSELLNKYYNVHTPEAEGFLRQFRSRYTSDDVIGKLDSLKDLRVLVIGEAIVDEYHYCDPMGKSSKESIVASRFVRSESFAGGSLACANHIAGFCDKIDLVTVLGSQDSQETFIRGNLKQNVTPTFFYRHDSPTIVKRRFVWEPFLTKLFEVYLFDDAPLPRETEVPISAYLKAVIADYDLVIVADYGHGMMSEKLIHQLCDEAKFLAVNTQTNSANAGFNLITKYPRADYVCIDEPEVRLATSDRRTEIDVLARTIAEQLGTKSLTITRGHKGSVTINGSDTAVHVPILSSEVKDRVGAGDAFLAVTAPAVCAGLSPEETGFIGNAVGALAVKIVGNKSSVEPVGLHRFITALLK